jgi:hypothetical protein
MCSVRRSSQLWNCGRNAHGTQRSATAPVSPKNAKLADQREWQTCLASGRLPGQELVRERLAVSTSPCPVETASHGNVIECEERELRTLTNES